MSRSVQYRSVRLEVAAGVVDRKISLSHSVLEFTVPINTINATVRLGDPGAEVVALQPGGKTKFCFGDDPPSAIYLTAPGGDAIVVFGSQGVEPTFSPFGVNGTGITFEAIGTYPAPSRLLRGQVVETNFQFLTGATQNILFLGGIIEGTGVDRMELILGRLSYHQDTTAVNLVKREWGVALPIHMPLTQLLSADQQEGELTRVYWDTFWLQSLGVPNMPLGTGVMYVFWNDTPGGWVNVSGFKGWGLAISDNGGGIPELHYASNRVVGVPTPDEDVNLGILVNVWRRIDVLHIAPTETRRARLLIYVDAALVIEREWQAGAGALPDYALLGATIVRWMRTDLSDAASELNLSGVILRRGQLLFDGTLL